MNMTPRKFCCCMFSSEIGLIAIGPKPLPAVMSLRRPMRNCSRSSSWRVGSKPVYSGFSQKSAQLAARVEHPRLDGVGRDADDFGDLFN